MYETHREKHVFSRVREGPVAQVGATWAQKSCPRGVRTAKMTEECRKRGQSSKSWAGQIRLSVKAMETTGTLDFLRQEVKVYLNDQSYE